MIKTDAMYAELVHKIDQATESGQIDAIKNRLDAIEADIPADASSSNKFSTASDITGITEKIPEAASSSNKMATASDITGITEKIPEGASSSNKLATASDITGITEKIPEGASSSNKLATASDITGITELIPSNASESNKLVTVADCMEKSVSVSSSSFATVKEQIEAVLSQLPSDVTYDRISRITVTIDQMKSTSSLRVYNRVDKTLQFAFLYNAYSSGIQVVSLNIKEDTKKLTSATKFSITTSSITTTSILNDTVMLHAEYTLYYK